MIDGAAGLDPAIVPFANDPAVMHQHRADGNPAFTQTLASLRDRGFEKRVFRHKPSIASQLRDAPSQSRTPARNLDAVFSINWD